MALSLKSGPRGQAAGRWVGGLDTYPYAFTTPHAIPSSLRAAARPRHPGNFSQNPAKALSMQQRRLKLFFYIFV